MSGIFIVKAHRVPRCQGPWLAAISQQLTGALIKADARAQAMAHEGRTVGCRVHPVRHEHGRAAWMERQEMTVVGLTGRTPYAPSF